VVSKKEEVKMTKQETMKTMTNGNISVKMSYLHDLDVIFDTYNRNIPNASEVVNILISFAMTSKEDELTNEILEVICSAQISQDLNNVDYDGIAKGINDVSERFLPRYIDILGNTGNAKYLPVIMSFKNHNNKSVQQSVKDALIELRIVESNN
jgi:hypothetical protein